MPPPPKKKLLTKYFYFHSPRTTRRFRTKKFNISEVSHWIILIRTCSLTLIPGTHDSMWYVIYYKIREMMKICYW